MIITGAFLPAFFASLRYMVNLVVTKVTTWYWFERHENLITRRFSTISLSFFQQRLISSMSLRIFLQKHQQKEQGGPRRWTDHRTPDRMLPEQ